MGMTIEGRITTTGSESIFSTTRASPRDLVNAYVFGRSPRILFKKYSCQNILVPLQSCPPLLVRHRVGHLLVHPLDGLNDLVGIGRRGVRLLLQMPLVQMTIGRGDMTKHLQYIVESGVGIEETWPQLLVTSTTQLYAIERGNSDESQTAALTSKFFICSAKSIIHMVPRVFSNTAFLSVSSKRMVAAQW